MGADPEPKYPILDFHAVCTVVQTDACREVPTDTFEADCRMTKIGLQVIEGSVGLQPNRFRQSAIAIPKRG